MYGAKKIDVVDNGQPAVEVATKTSYDMIFMDVRMPVMGGLEATRTLRQRGVTSFVVGHTGGTTTEEEHACYESGMDEFLSKPAPNKKVREKIEIFLARHSQSAA